MLFLFGKRRPLAIEPDYLKAAAGTDHDTIGKDAGGLQRASGDGSRKSGEQDRNRDKHKKQA
ncbi:MAG: hypothetical protein CMI61_08515 [Parvibaculum sp.]|nr:hypothetical protein [Parvibaculum sp.]